MIYQKILLKDIDSRIEDEDIFLRIYISDVNRAVSFRPGLLICPGGGYERCSEREAEPVAFRFLSEGFNCFILNYSCHKPYPYPHRDVAIAVNYIREHENDFCLLPSSLSLIGFSAGGHLIGSYAYLYPELASLYHFEVDILKPRSIVLAYPVTTTTWLTHKVTNNIITGDSRELWEKMDIISHVDANYPPTFIWTTKDDGTVPYQNSVLMAEVLNENHIKNEVHIFSSGWHGASLANRSVAIKGELTKKMKDLRDWASLASDFMLSIIENEKE